MVRKLQKLDIEFARTHFPALASDWVFFENAGGTLAANSVLQRTQAYMKNNIVQPGASFEASAEGLSKIEESQNLMAHMIGAHPSEVMIGPSTTMNVFLLSHAIRGWFKEGDEIIVTNLDHEANNGAWRRLEEFGLVIREWRFNKETAELEISTLEGLLSDRTCLVCFSHLSNIVGSINDVTAITKLAHQAGALVCVDGVAYAPHRAIDVKKLDVDFYLCSLYKLYGPHLSLLYGKQKHLKRLANNNHYFLSDKIPLKLNPGGSNHELTAGLAGIIDYFDLLHKHHFGDSNIDLHERIQQVFELIADHEEKIAASFAQFLEDKKEIRLIGLHNVEKKLRVPIFSFTVAGRQSSEIPSAVLPNKIAVRSGDFYAARCIRDLGFQKEKGVVRVSMVHYNSANDVNRLIEALDHVI